jgi:integrase
LHFYAAYLIARADKKWKGQYGEREKPNAQLAREAEPMQRALTAGTFWNQRRYVLVDVNDDTCAEYVAWRTDQPWKSAKPEQTGNKAELEDLRAAINLFYKKKRVNKLAAVTLPEKPLSREDWLTRSEAARLIRAAWRRCQVMRDKSTKRLVGRHLARFVLVGLYTGTRAGAICGAALHPAIGRGRVDLKAGVFYRRALGASESKKRQPQVRIPERLLAHLRRWERLGIAKHAVVEWNGKPVRSVRKAFEAVVRDAGLGGRKITPHILRHTAATWAMQGGADPYKTANTLGMTYDTLMRVYGHHHPEADREFGDVVTGRRRPHLRA